MVDCKADCPNWRPIQGYSMAGCKANCTESRACDYKDMYWTADKFVLELPDGCVMRTQYERFQDFVDNDAKKYKDLRVTTNPSIDPVLQVMSLPGVKVFESSKLTQLWAVALGGLGRSQHEHTGFTAA